MNRWFHLNSLVEPDSFLRSRFASADALFSAAKVGFALALFSFAFSFFREAFSPELRRGTTLGAMTTTLFAEKT